MLKSNNEIEKIIEYMKAHWPSLVKPEWQVGLGEYPEIAKKVLSILGKQKTRNGQLIRIAGLSGSGKTTQILPAAEAYFESRKMQPVLVAARRFVEYHPHYQEILEFYGEENIRKMTDEFATIMMFLVLEGLIKNRFDIILDVTLLDPAMEAILLKMTKENNYQCMLLMTAVSTEVTQKFLDKRNWRHTKETEQEFARATELALDFYAKNSLKMRSVFWNAYDLEPIYDGNIENGVSIFKKYSQEINIPEHDEEMLKRAKINYLKR